MIKPIAFYLPQFHEIPENNNAWGEGFTEWTNVQKARPLFWGHNQPRKPWKGNYYNLLEDGVMKWQAKLAKKCGIYGFCFYHYWFGGRMVLEKPVELWLGNKTIHLHYCFAWANEPWTKTWHGAGGNKEILIPQIYGGEDEWKAHYEYFRPYFMDDRYIKENNCPVLLIYRLRNISRFNDMLRYWDKCAKEDGFSGIFVISMNVCKEHVGISKWVGGSVDFEPNKTRWDLPGKRLLLPKENGSIFWNRFALWKINYKTINERMLHEPHKKNHFRSLFVDFDDSPRRGIRALMAEGSTPERFGEYLRRAIRLSKEEENEYLFINAWNEWGEGNYLEPDEKYGYGYLRQLKQILKEES